MSKYQVSTSMGLSRVLRCGLPLTFCLALALLTGGCGFFGGGEDEGPQNKVTVSLKPAAKAVKPAPQAAAAAEDDKDKLTLDKLRQMQEEKAQSYIFLPEGMLDPFRPITVVTEARPAQAEGAPEVPLTPLQKMELSQLKLVAVVEAGENTRALVEDSTGMGYIVQVGTLMGTRNGQVVDIKPDRVEVQEMFKNYLGEQKARVSVLKLNPIEGEKQ